MTLQRSCNNCEHYWEPQHAEPCFECQDAGGYGNWHPMGSDTYVAVLDAKEAALAEKDARIKELEDALKEIRDRYKDVSECECDFYDDDGDVIFCDYHIAVRALEAGSVRDE